MSGQFLAADCVKVLPPPRGAGFSLLNVMQATVQKFGFACHRSLIRYSQMAERPKLYLLMVFHAFRVYKRK